MFAHEQMMSSMHSSEVDANVASVPEETNGSPPQKWEAAKVALQCWLGDSHQICTRLVHQVCTRTHAHAPYAQRLKGKDVYDRKVSQTVTMTRDTAEHREEDWKSEVRRQSQAPPTLTKGIKNLSVELLREEDVL